MSTTAATFLADHNLKTQDNETLQAFQQRYDQHQIESKLAAGHQITPARYGTKIVFTTTIETLRIIAKQHATQTNEQFTVGETQFADRQGTWHAAWIFRSIPTATQITLYPHATPIHTTTTILTADYLTFNDDGQPKLPAHTTLCEHLSAIAEAITLRRIFPDTLQDIYLTEELTTPKYRRWDTFHPPKEADQLIDSIIEIISKKTPPGTKTQEQINSTTAKTAISAISEYEQAGGEITDLIRVLKHIDANITFKNDATLFTGATTINVTVTTSHLSYFQCNVLLAWLKHKTHELIQHAKTT